MKKIKSTILFVEDSKTARENFKDVIGDFVEKYYIATNGEEGFNLYLEYKPDIIITDVEMPVIDGLSMAKRIKRMDEDIPIIVLSAHSKVELFIKAIKIGIKEFLFKPIEPHTLKKTLRKISKHIEEKREIEEKLKLTQNAMDMSPISIWMVNEYGKLVYANQAFINILGYSFEELQNLRIDDIDKNHTPRKINENIKFIKNKGHIQFETILTKKDGSTFPAEILVSYLSENIYCAFIQDITIRKKQEELINKKSEKLIELATLLEEKVDSEIRKRLEKEVLISSIFDNATFGIALTDINRKFVKVNSAFCKLVGYSEDELIGSDLLILVPISRQKEANDIHEMEFYDNIEGQEIIIKKRSGDEIFIHIVKSTIEVLKEKLELVIFTDITHIKKIEDERNRQKEMLIQQSKMASMGEMIGAIAHQWKQPLNVLAGNLVNLDIAIELDSLNEDEIRECIHHSNNQIQFMAQTIDDFRNFFKPTKEKLIFSVKEAIDEIIGLLMPQFKNNAIEVHIKSKEELNTIGYPNEFKQVVLNILNNAKDAILEKRHQNIEKNKFYEQIVIKLSKENNMVVITICDNGGGIKENILPKIFEPYVSSKGDRGTGIGLHLSKTIIENSFNGVIYAKNSSCINDKIGAKFVIEVPYATN